LGYFAERVGSRHSAETALAWHVQLGILLLGLTLLRVAWRLLRGVPRADNEPRWQRTAARAVHCALYVLLLALPVAGYVIVVWMGEATRLFGLIDLPHLFTPPAEDERGRAIAWYTHVYGAWLLIGLVGVHVAAATWHRMRGGEHRQSA
jgi:cytochrome b561